MFPSDVVMAHQGGWDELLMFLVPVALAVVAVRFAERRAKRRKGVDTEAKPGPDGVPPSDTETAGQTDQLP